MEDKKIIVGLGEVLWDCLPDGRKIGGAPANFAFHASQFGNEAWVVSAVGTDALADETVGAIEGKGLKCLMPRVGYPTGVVDVTLDAAGVATYDIRENSAWDNIPLTPEMTTLAGRCNAVCFGSLSQRNGVSRRAVYGFLDAVGEGCLRICDINLRQHYYSKEIVCESLRHCDILKINDDELAEISRMFGYAALGLEDKCWLILGKYNLRMLILTCGADGSYVFSEGRTSFVETPRVDVADTVGAGDSFTGTFVSAILDGVPLPEAHRRAVDVSAYVCTQHGAMPRLPERLRGRWA